MTLLDSVVSGNTAFANPRPGALHRGGGGLRVGGCPSVLVVAGARIEDNVSHWEGGGILAYAGLQAAQPGATVVVERSDVRFNTAVATNGGGGIYRDRAALTLIDSKVRNNYASDIEQGPNP